MGVGYLAGASCLGMSGDTGILGGMDSTVRQFSNIFGQLQLMLIANRRCLLEHH